MASKLYVGNLAFEVTDDGLQKLFTDAGFQVESARVIRDMDTGRSRGFGFVELAVWEDMSRAISTLSGQTVFGRVIQVNEARPQAPRREHHRGGRGGYGGRGRQRY